MEPKRICIIGVGLIGGSLAIRLRNTGIAAHIIGVDSNCHHLSTAMEMGLIDEVGSVEHAISLSELIIVAIPVDRILELLPSMLDRVNNQVIMDMGSTKAQLLAQIKSHPRRGRFVATHPMWGTEYSGPQASVRDGAFEGRTAVLCNVTESDEDALQCVREMYGKIGMRLLEVDACAHDLHVAYVSHISHITSFALANTVLEKEKEENTILELASGGFESTVRLAKSSSDMWLPIFRQNRENVLDVINEHIAQLRKFKSCLEKENYEYLGELIANANKIGKILK